ncbi:MULTISPECIES: Flp family type IVb pilin [Ferrimonas]|uniref:Flp family type IVb pilin n=1 Tax=Ferrimonas TaxID=44011 RepID=UPI0003FC0DEF|nr:MULTISPECIES: pilus assembly protein PilA [Ferrimonas]USD36506.1 Flp family type IVb pilin [Ferrimonas sp. SCSIO 43195]
MAILHAVRTFWLDESGLSAVEYAIAGSLVAGGMVIAFTELGTETSEQISAMCAVVDAAGDCDGQ